jgi:Flp pilus assembly protein TadD
MPFKIFPDRLRVWHCLALLFIATFGVYFNSLDNGLVAFDDAITLSSDPGNLGGVESLKLALGKARHDPKIAVDILFRGRSLTVLTKALDKKLFGDEYSLHRLVNISWHFLAACFALLAATELSGSPAFGLAAALVFALHPVQTESVTYLAGRRDVLYGTLSLASLYLWLLGARTGRRELKWGALAAWALAMTAKQAAVTVPCLWLAAEALRGTAEPWRVVIRRHLKLLAALGAAAAVMVSYSLAQELRSGLGSATYWYGGGALSQWLTEPRIVLHAITLLLWPARLSVDYSYSVFEPSQSFLDPRFIGAIFFLSALGWLAWRLREKRPLAAFALLWIALSYAPMLHILPAQHNREVFAEHWLYLPVFGFSLLLAAALKAASEKFPKASWTAFAVVMALYGMRTAARNRDWKDDVTLWSKTAQTYPQCARAHAVLGWSWLHRGEPAQAEAELRKAMDLGTDDPRTFINLAYVYRMTGRLPEAKELLLRAHELPLAALYNDVIWNSLAMVYYQTQDIESIRRWINEKPGAAMGLTPQIIEQFGLAAARSGDMRLAERLFIKSGDERTPFNLGSLYFGQGRFRLAVPWLEKAVLVNPTGFDERILTGLICLELGRIPQAEVHLVRAVRLAPGSASGWLAYSQLRVRQGKIAEALAAARKAAKLEDSPRTRSQLEQTLRAMSGGIPQ